jgi:hypothetical protein
MIRALGGIVLWKKNRGSKILRHCPFKAGKILWIWLLQADDPEKKNKVSRSATLTPITPWTNASGAQSNSSSSGRRGSQIGGKPTYKANTRSNWEDNPGCVGSHSIYYNWPHSWLQYVYYSGNWEEEKNVQKLVPPRILLKIKRYIWI